MLEPVPVPGRLTESAVKEALQLAALPENADAQRIDGANVTVNGTALKWHALDTLNYNVNLYHFAWALSKPTSNVLFWVETTVDSPREMSGRAPRHRLERSFALVAQRRTGDRAQR